MIDQHLNYGPENKPVVRKLVDNYGLPIAGITGASALSLLGALSKLKRTETIQTIR